MELLGKSSSVLCTRLARCMGYNVRNTSLYSLFMTLIRTLQLEVFLSRKLYLYTSPDENGEVYTFLYHLLMDWTACKISGYPRWDVCDDDLEMALIKGPICIDVDACRLSYNKLQFQGGITGRIHHKTKARGVLFTHLQLSTETDTKITLGRLPTQIVYIRLHDTWVRWSIKWDTPSKNSFSIRTLSCVEDRQNTGAVCDHPIHVRAFGRFGIL